MSEILWTFYFILCCKTHFQQMIGKSSLCDTFFNKSIYKSTSFVPYLLITVITKRIPPALQEVRNGFRSFIGEALLSIKPINKCRFALLTHRSK